MLGLVQSTRPPNWILLDSGKEALSHSSGYAESWSCCIDSKPGLLYIKPPPVTSLRQEHRRAVALFCLEAALQQVRQGCHFVLVHREDEYSLESPSGQNSGEQPGSALGTCVGVL